MRARLLGAVALIAGLVAVSPVAQAAPESASGVCYPTPQSGCTVAPFSVYNQYKFWPYDPAWVCVANGDNGIPIGAAAQSWNNASAGLYLTFSNNCVSAGYTPSTRMTIDTYNAVDGNCTKVTNNTYAVGPDGFRRYTNNPIGWVNVNPTQACASTSFRRAHWTTYVIGQIIGLTGHRDVSNTTWDSRVMAYRTQDTIAWAEQYSGAAVSDLYQGNLVGVG